MKIYANFYWVKSSPIGQNSSRLPSIGQDPTSRPIRTQITKHRFKKDCMKVPINLKGYIKLILMSLAFNV